MFFGRPGALLLEKGPSPSRPTFGEGPKNPCFLTAVHSKIPRPGILQIFVVALFLRFQCTVSTATTAAVLNARKKPNLTSFIYWDHSYPSLNRFIIVAWKMPKSFLKKPKSQAKPGRVWNLELERIASWVFFNFDTHHIIQYGTYVHVRFLLLCKKH